MTQPFGVAGGVKVMSYTEPSNNLFTYQPWLIKKDQHWQEIYLKSHRPHGKGFVAFIENILCRDAAIAMSGKNIYIHRSQLPELNKGEYYWSDLIGLSVFNQKGDNLGKITGFYETGANDVMIITGETSHHIPYVLKTIIKAINLNDKTMTVDWDE